MPANIYKNNVYSLREAMWHALGTVGQNEQTAEQVYGEMTPVEFVLRPFSIQLNGASYHKNDFGIVRVGEKEALVGRTKGRYSITQPAQYCKIFDEAVQRPVETLGFLGKDGDRMFITWKLPAIDIYGDVVELYGFLAVGFDGLFGEKAFITKVRVVCGNTWSAAIQDAGEATYSGKHNYTNHEATLFSWLRYIQQEASERVEIQKALFCKMQSTPVDADTAYGLFAKVYPYANELSAYYPPDLRSDKEEKIANTNQKVDESRDLAMSLFQGAGIEISKTAWGVLNSVTEAENHHRASKKDTTYSILLGNRYGIMSTAESVVKSFVEAQ